MSAITDALTTIRDDAHLNQTALALVKTAAEGQRDSVKLWPNSSMKRGLMAKLGDTISGYLNAQREALELRDNANDALFSMTAVVPPLPDTGDGSFPPWSEVDW